MSKADDMFKELGYKKEEHNFKYGNVIEYDDGNRQIDFIFRDKEVKIWNIAIALIRKYKEFLKGVSNE